MIFRPDTSTSPTVTLSPLPSDPTIVDHQDERTQPGSPTAQRLRHGFHNSGAAPRGRASRTRLTTRTQAVLGAVPAIRALVLSVACTWFSPTPGRVCSSCREHITALPTPVPMSSQYPVGAAMHLAPIQAGSGGRSSVVVTACAADSLLSSCCHSALQSQPCMPSHGKVTVTVSNCNGCAS